MKFKDLKPGDLFRYYYYPSVFMRLDTDLDNLGDRDSTIVCVHTVENCHPIGKCFCDMAKDVDVILISRGHG